ncbi:unnamed protein product [Linum trigynum]|uniref:Uncharacterized protein n=1 Tax=Linum trigynum TaxID=586398 RepID=A0AAV2F8D3_9ROSI
MLTQPLPYRWRPLGAHSPGWACRTASHPFRANPPALKGSREPLHASKLLQASPAAAVSSQPPVARVLHHPRPHWGNQRLSEWAKLLAGQLKRPSRKKRQLPPERP